MAFETGAYTDLHDLLNKLRIFVLANGWLVDEYVAGSGSTTDTELYIHRGTSQWVSMKGQIWVAEFRTFHGVSQSVEWPRLNLYGNTGYNVANNVDNQPGSSFQSTQSVAPYTTWMFSGNYYFFTNVANEYVHVVVDILPNEFMHFGFGIADKFGAYTGGEYLYGTDHEQFADYVDVPESERHIHPFSTNVLLTDPSDRGAFRAVSDGYDWRRISGSTSTTGVFGSWNSLSITDSLFNSAPYNYNAGVVLHPIILSVGRTTTTKRSPVGSPKDFRTLNIRNLIPGQAVTLGADVWYVFPVVYKKEPSIRDNLPNTGYFGYAYKRIL